MSGMSSPPAGLGQSHRRHRRSPGAQAAELCQVWQALCVREHQARDRNRQLLQDFGQLETQLGLLWARTDAVRRRKVDYEEFLQRLLQRMKAGSPGWVPQHQDWVSTRMLDLPLRSRPGRHLPNPPEQMDQLQHQTPWPHPVSPQSPEPAAFLASTGAGGAAPTEATRPPGGPHRKPWLLRRPIAKDGGYRLLTPMRHQESAPLLPPHRLSFPSTAEWKGARPQPMQTRACAGAGLHTEAAASSGTGHRHCTANRASRRLLWREAWEQDSTETACEEPWDRVPRLWHKEKPGGDTAPLDQGGSWGQEPWGEQAGDDGSEESVGSPRWGLRVRGRQPGRNRDPGEGVELKEEVGHVLSHGVGQLEEGEGDGGCSAMGQIQEEGEGEEGLAGGQGGQEVGGKDEEGNREESAGGAREEEAAQGKRSSVLGHVQASAQGGKDEEGLVERGGQEEEEEEGLAGGQGGQKEKDDSKREEGLVWGQEGNEDEESLAKGPRDQSRTEEESEEEEGLAGRGGQVQGEEEESSEEEEEGLVEWGGQEEGEEEEGSEEEEGLAGRGGQAQGEEEEGSKEEEGLAGRGGQVQGEEEESSEEEEEGLVEWGGQEEEGSEEEEGLAGRGGQAQGEEEEGSEEEEGLVEWGGQEEEGSEEEEGLVEQQGGQEGGEEDEGSEGLAVGGAEGHVQEEDADSDLVLGPQGGPGSGVELGRGRDPPAWNSHTLKAPHGQADLGQDSTWGEEEEAESDADDDIEAALAPPGNALEPRVKRRTSESHELRRGSQGSPSLQEGSREVSGQGDSEELGADLEMSLREDQSLDDQDNFYD